MFLGFNARRTVSFISWGILFLLLLGGCRNEHHFRFGKINPPASRQAFIVLGDSRSGDDVYRKIIDTITSTLSYSNCLIHTGDMIYATGERWRWKNFLDMTAPVSAIMPWYGVVGNHDVDSTASQQIYQEVMNLPGNELYYSFNTLDSHFIVLDTEIPGQEAAIVGEQLNWLKHDLQTYAPSAQYIFVFTHQPPYPQGHYKGHNLVNADELHQLFVQYGVDMVFSGHEHQYHFFQKDSVSYVITGGAGAELREGANDGSFHHFLLIELLPSKTISISVLDIFGKVISVDTVKVK